MLSEKHYYNSHTLVWPHFSLCNKRDTHPVLYCSWQVITRAHLHFSHFKGDSEGREHVVVRKKQEKVHFLRGTKNDGKASLRGYMHTNWPQQRGSLLKQEEGVKKAYRKLFFFETKPARPLVLAVTKPFVVIVTQPQHFLWGTLPYADWRTSENPCNMIV